MRIDRLVFSNLFPNFCCRN